MTDRVKGFTVTLEQDIRVDDVEVILNAVRMVKGVAHVEPSLTTMEDHMNRTLIRLELEQKIYEMLRKDR